jgi:hypothetical protein
MSSSCVLTFEGDFFAATMIELSESEFDSLMIGADSDLVMAWQQKLLSTSTIQGFTFSKTGAHFTAYIGDDPYPRITTDFETTPRDIPASFLRMASITPIGKAYIAYEKYSTHVRHEYVAQETFEAEALTLARQSCLLPDGKLASVINPLYHGASFTPLEAWTEREDYYIVSPMGEQFNLHFA